MTNKIRRCSLWFCDEKHYGMGLCVKHYAIMNRRGTPLGLRSADMVKVLGLVAEAQPYFEMVSDERIWKEDDGSCRVCGKNTSDKDDDRQHYQWCSVEKAEKYVFAARQSRAILEAMAKGEKLDSSWIIEKEETKDEQDDDEGV